MEMTTKTARRRQRWQGVIAEIKGGHAPDVYLSSGGRLCMVKGGDTLPQRVADQLPESVRHGAAEERKARTEVFLADRAEAKERLAERGRAWWAGIDAKTFALWLDTGYVEDFIGNRLAGADGTPQIPRDGLVNAIKWNLFRETNSQTCAHLGELRVAPLGEDGEFVFDANSDILDAELAVLLI